MFKQVCLLTVCLFAIGICGMSEPRLHGTDEAIQGSAAQATSPASQEAEHPSTQTPNATADLAGSLGISFVEGSTSTMIVAKDGKKYLVDLTARTVREAEKAPETPASNLQQAQPTSTAAPPAQTAETPKEEEPKVYEPGDDHLFSLPTGRRLERHGFYIDFTHRFPYEAAFSGQSRGHTLMGLDDFAIPSFGLAFGVTKKFSVSAFRSPSIVGRPIQLMAAYNVWDEHDKNPFNFAVRFSVEGQNDFSRNFTVNFEGIFSRSIAQRAQLYVVPTVSLHNRPLLQSTASIQDPPPFQPCSAPLAQGVSGGLKLRPCADTFSLGFGIAVDIRPTVALVAEVIPTLVNGRDLGIHRPAFAFGIQKKLFRHAFTFGWTNSPGVTVSQRAGTRATFLGQPSADTPSGVFIGFDLTRQIY